MTPSNRRPLPLPAERVPPIFSRRGSSKAIFNVIKGIFLAHLFTEYIGEVKQTQGPSMLPTLSVYGDRVYVSKLYRRGKGIRVGDVITLKHPMFPGTGASKRVLGMPGDFIVREDPATVASSINGMGSQMIQIPEGHCWVAGDNVSASRDSREYGPLPLALIKGKVIARVWPPKDIKWMENTFQPVESNT